MRACVKAPSAKEPRWRFWTTIGIGLHRCLLLLLLHRWAAQCCWVDAWLIDAWLIDAWLIDAWLIDAWLIDAWLIDAWLIDAWLIDAWFLSFFEAYARMHARMYGDSTQTERTPSAHGT